jgi:hypothetical protein
MFPGRSPKNADMGSLVSTMIYFVARRARLFTQLLPQHRGNRPMDIITAVLAFPLGPCWKRECLHQRHHGIRKPERDVFLRPHARTEPAEYSALKSSKSLILLDDP